MTPSEEPIPSTSPGVLRIIDAFTRRRDALTEQTVLAIRQEVQGYSGVDDPAFLEDVRQHVAEHHGALLRMIMEQRPLTREDLLFIRRHTIIRVRKVTVAEYMWAFRIGQNVIWTGIHDQVQDDETREAALALVRPVLDYVNLAATYAADLYVEVEQLAFADLERVRRDLLEDLIAGRPLRSGRFQDLARDAGLGRTTPFVAIVALARATPKDENVLRSAAEAVARAAGTALAPLTVLRRDEIVILAPARGLVPERLTKALADSCVRLIRHDVVLAIGVSTVHPGLDGAPAAYGEARRAADRVGTEGGVLALPALTAFDYLTSFDDGTAARLISPDIWRFVQADIKDGGTLTTTLLEYAASNLSVKAAAERLNVHVNTAHYRLRRIAEETGRDLRNLTDVLDLVIAARLAQPRPEP